MSNSDIFCSHSPWSGVLSSFFILYRWLYAWYILVNRVCHVIVYSFWGKSRTLLCTLVLVDPYGGYYVLPFMSWNHIVYIIPHDQLLFFDHSFFHSILFFILSYLSYPWWSSSFEVDLPLSEALSSVMVSLTLGAIAVNLELSSLVLQNKSHSSCRRLYRTFPTIQMHQLHG